MTCERVPIFEAVDLSFDGQLYKYGERYYALVGWVPGCGREYADWCRSCRNWMPVMTDRPTRGRWSNKDAATDEREVQV